MKRSFDSSKKARTVPSLLKVPCVNVVCAENDSVAPEVSAR